MSSLETTTTKKNWEVSDILELGMEQYISHFGYLISGQGKVIKALKDCRTSNMGGHIYSCDTCDFEKNAYYSCRNRHCPKCQGLFRYK